ncbi:hypothetical protein BXP70_26190 [Hymenobacter crusticola]|uniref:SbsA Ig-like domain-containing protein n=1 Tax=Hymenobacter crusticola TaxID=1770526 RepID=A0A243W6M2_9BACT|nr:hypothetical protein BXP70_26190 [Hymenobacter crusticola]
MTKAVSAPLWPLFFLLVASSTSLTQAQTLTVLNREPAANTNTAAVAINVKLTFSQDLQATSVSAVTLHSRRAGGRKAGTITTSGTMLTVDPASDFLPGEPISVSVSRTVQGITAVLAAPQVYQFTTAVGGTGRGNFLAGASLSIPGQPAGIAIGDVDGDGDVDLLVSSRSTNKILVHLNGGDATGSNTGTFSGNQTVAVGLSPTTVALADVDNDGDLDLLAANTTAGTVSVRLNGGDATGSATGFFTGNQEVSVGLNPSALATGDVDGDGDLDLLTLNRTSGTVSVRLNGGDDTGSATGVFSGSQDLSFGSSPTSLALGDVDNDGDLDLFVTNIGIVTVRLNGGDATGTNSGTFRNGQTVFVGAQPVDLAVGDVNGDGALDLLTANAESGTVSVRLKNRSTGYFTGSQEVAVGASLSTVALADVDADGDLDLIAADGSASGGTATTNQVQVRLNGGDATGSNSGVFTNGFSAIVGRTPIALILGDVDGDGDLDLLTANAGTSTVSVCLNQPPPPTITQFTPSRAVAGETVTLTGQALSNATLLVGGLPVPVTSNTATSLTFVVPTGATASQPTVVTTRYGSRNSTAFTVQLKVTSTTPTTNALNVVRDGSAVQINFSEPISAATATTLPVFSRQVGGQKAGTVTTQGSTLRFAATTGTSSTNFYPGEVVQVSVPSRIRNLGNTGATGHVFQFTTAVGGSGRANFRPGSDPIVYDTPYAVATADVDGDGDLDLVSSNFGAAGSTVSVLPNNGNGTFGYAAPIYAFSNTYSGPLFLTTGDLDGDGDIDIIIANGFQTGLLFNNGRGTFNFNIGPSVSSGTGISPHGITLGDVDGDGDLDLLTATYGNSVIVRFNNGSGRFTDGQTLMVGTGPIGITTADVDNDGDLDLLASVASSNSVAVRLNDGTGAFSGSVNVPVGSAPYNVTAADVDADGDLDLLTANQGSTGNGNTVSVCLNDGQGTFSRGSDSVVGLAPSDVVTADVDSDGDLDLLTTSYSTNKVSVRLNDGRGQFGGGSDPEVDTNTFTRTGALSLATGDLDNDGDLDFVTANTGNSTGNTVSVRLNQPAAPVLLSFTPAEGLPGTLVTLSGTGFTNVTAVTFNGVSAAFTVLSATQLTATVPPSATSGLLAVITPGGTATSSQPYIVTGAFTVSAVLPTRNQRNAARLSPVSVTFNQLISPAAASLGALHVLSQRAGGHKAGSVTASGNTLTFTPTVPFKPGETLTATLTTAVQNLSGRSLGTGQVFQFTTAAGSGSGAFPPLTVAASVVDNPLETAAADMDGDGDLDIVTLNYASAGSNAGASSLSIRFNDGKATFSGTTTVFIGRNASALAVADADNDGDLDLFTISDDYHQIDVRLNNGAGTSFTQGANVLVGHGALSLIAADVNADGYTDLLATNTSDNTVSIRLNNQVGGFLNSGEVNVSTTQAPLINPGWLAVADVDGDGDLDLITVNQNPNSFSVRLNNGAGVFSGNYLLALAGRPQCLRMADVNGDGVQDALVGFFDSRIQVLLGTGSGGFTNGTVVSVGNFPRFIAVGDIDGDSDLDLLAANGDAFSISIRVNNGQGQFSGTSSLTTGQNPSGITLADLDGDTDLDVLMANYTDGKVSISLNPGSLPTATQSATLAADITLYPNPAHQHFCFVLPPLNVTTLTLTLRNTVGQAVRTQVLRVPASQTAIEFDATGLAAGVYILQGQAGTHLFTKQVILE